MSESTDQAALSRAIAARDWDTFDQIVGNTPAEVERLLSHGSFVDAADVNQLIEQLDANEERGVPCDIAATCVLIDALATLPALLQENIAGHEVRLAVSLKGPSEQPIQ